MPYTWDEIESEWLGDGRVAMLMESVVGSFNRLDELFGRDWVEQRRRGGSAKGALVTLSVATEGEWAQALDAVKKPDVLIEKLEKGLPDAWAELKAIYLIWNRSRHLRFEYEPLVTVGGRERRPDFSVLEGESVVVIVEVTKPDMSEVETRLREIMTGIAKMVEGLTGSFAVEAFLLREPNDEELKTLTALIPEMVGAPVSNELTLPNGLGSLFLDDEPGGQIVLRDRGYKTGPMLGVASSVVGGGERRHISVRLAYSDERVERLLRTEARQLPDDVAGLIMIQTSDAPGAMRSWEPLIRRRFQPEIHTRVSGVALMHGGIVGTPQGESWRPEVVLLSNEFATNSLPEVISEALKSYPRISVLDHG